MDVMYFIFIFISSSVPKFSMKKSVNQLIKNKRPKVPMANLKLSTACNNIVIINVCMIHPCMSRFCYEYNILGYLYECTSRLYII